MLLFKGTCYHACMYVHACPMRMPNPNPKPNPKPNPRLALTITLSHNPKPKPKPKPRPKHVLTVHPPHTASHPAPATYLACHMRRHA